MNRSTRVLVAFALVLASSALAAGAADRAEARAAGLVARMTLDEKLGFVGGSADPRKLGGAGYVPGVPRLGIPELRLTDGPAGVRVAAHATAMPAPIALASAFDPGLARAYGAVLGRDGRALGQDVLLSPMVNTIRVPVAGRNFETFSEDPLVSARTVAAEVAGVQSQGLMATVKHFAEYNQETDRDTVDVSVDDRTVHEIELPGFRAAVDAGAASVMCAYNKVNTVYACANEELLHGILREELGFRGWVMSDWYGTHSTDSISKGLDQEMPNGLYLGTALRRAVLDGTIPESTVDASVRRILTQMCRFGLLDRTPPPRPERDAAGGARAALAVAEQGAVLLRNESGALPLSDAPGQRIAVIGPTARVPKIGGGGSSHVVPDHADAPLDTIRARAGQDSTVSYSPGGTLDGLPIPPASFDPPLPVDADGVVSVPQGQTAVYNGDLLVPGSGEYLVSLSASGSGYGVLEVDGQTAYAGGNLGLAELSLHLDAGRHKVALSRLAGLGIGVLKLTPQWVTAQRQREYLAPAVDAARQAGTAIVFAYDDSAEGTDRHSVSLPGYQDELITEVARVNPNTVVVLNTGSAVAMPWLNGVRAVLDMWYPGQEGAAATTALLYGDASPSGRLTQTFPTSLAATPFGGHPERFPGVAKRAEYSEGIFTGYRWYDANRVRPLFPFGYGLTYTSFAYSDPRAKWRDGGLDVEFTLRNTGTRPGREVAQVYLGPSPDVAVPQAVRALAGYQGVFLRPEESRRVKIHVDAQQLRYWTGTGWALGTGTRTVSIGASSADLPLSTAVTVR
ncbi:beta-glucosidase [Kutzneria viridogrisea]|uniref:Beta-glucosidase n=1 Tax=Kutzneria viridogrisea TaxID=47990 RepID=A0ABR6BJ76_9PSEU|nr:beta-glucosidase [Kutzneria viridogrisea]